MKALVRKLSKATMFARREGPPPHSVHLQKHPQYPARSTVKRVRWSEPDEEYAPVEFTHPSVLANDRSIKEGGWADPSDWTPELLAEVKNRTSSALVLRGNIIMFEGKPRNPMGRTGMSGRGLLGKWGPNHAADPLVTRFDPETGLLQMVAICRRDTGEWAIPGGMVDDGEKVSTTLKREFIEEARNVENESDKLLVEEKLELLFSQGGKICYFGYVDDPRNTDQAWMETVCVHFHIHDPFLASNMSLRGGDDAFKAKWLNVNDEEPDFRNLYVNHRDMVVRALLAEPLFFKSAMLKVGL